jgi:hypothetical protein
LAGRKRRNQDIARLSSQKASAEQFLTVPHFWHNPGCPVLFTKRCGAANTRNPRLLFLLFGLFLLRLDTRALS